MRPLLSSTYRSWTYTISRAEDGGHWMAIHDERCVLQHSSWLNASAADVEKAARQTIDAMQAANERQEGKAA